MFQKRQNPIILTVFLVFFASVVSIFGTLYVYTGNNQLGKFLKAKEILTANYYMKVDQEKLIEGAISGMANSLEDKYTGYYTKEEWKALEQDLEGSYVGIGVSIKVDNEGLITIAEFFNGSGAKEVGMKIGDKVVKVDGQDVRKLKSDVVISMIKGKEKTSVKLTIVRESEGKTLNFLVERRRIKVDNIEGKILPGEIGYIAIKKFDVEISKYFNEELDKLIQQGIKGLVLDVRDNPGGYYEQVVKIADRILPKGVIVYTENRNREKDTRYSDESEVKLPLAVLINGNSASASEILAGAIKDHKKGWLVGQKSFGKGLVQTSVTFNDGSGLKFTIQRYFTPAGVSIHGKGIEPDEAVLLSEEFKDLPLSEIPEDKDLQLKRAVEYVRAKIQ